MITISFFELFKIGPGPSSSHTVGPMLAANQFREELLSYVDEERKADWKLRVELLGSLAATGKGHGTHRAVLAGLYGEKPATADIEMLNSIFEHPDREYIIPFNNEVEIRFVESDIFFDFETFPEKHPNTLRFILLKNQHLVKEATFYSIGGGFILREGEEEESSAKAAPPYPYANLSGLLAILKDKSISISDLLMANEMAISGLKEEEVLKKMDKVIEVMAESVRRGLQAEGELPGGLHVFRRGKNMYEKALEMEANNRLADALMMRMNAYALATSEENAAGQMVVTAPTNGAAGIIPAALAYLNDDCKIPLIKQKKGLLVAAMIGFVIKENASISGAELGCMAEVGSASAMAAALFAYCFDANVDQIASAAEIAIEHHLGMTCDPIDGLVQVPCIERNANGVIKAYNAYLMAISRSTKPIIGFDQVVEVMRQTGKDLSEKYKETAKGGLAQSFGWGNMPGS